MTKDRILQISNNVSEEYTDDGDTSFATKKELCEVIKYFQRQCDAWAELHHQLQHKVLQHSLEVMTLPQHP